VLRVCAKEGDWVSVGDLLIELDPYDEERAKERADAEVTRAQAMLDRAKIAYQQRKEDQPTLVEIAQADLDRSKATYVRMKAEWDRIQLLKEKDAVQFIEDVRTKSSLDEAKAAVQLAEAQLQKTITSAHEIDVYEQEIAQAESTLSQALAAQRESERRLTETKIYSPVDGLVLSVSIRDGERTIGTDNSVAGLPPLMVLADVSKLYVNAEVDEADIGRVRNLVDEQRGQGLASADDEALPVEETPLEITVEAFRDEIFEGKISRIKPMPKQESAVTTYDVEIEVTDPRKEKLFLGMQAEVRFTAQTIENALLVPNEAVRTEGNDIGVYVPDCADPTDADQRMAAEEKFVVVKRGLTNGLETEIREGLEEGQWVYKALPIKMSSEEPEE
jgi:multidrug efflux pump subunit AcrA (membrane-fusion protein)